MKILQHIDGSNLQSDNFELISFMQDKKLFNQNEFRSISFCGFLIFSNEMHFFWPKTCKPVGSHEEAYKLGRLVLSTLKRYSLKPLDTLSGNDKSAEIIGIPPIVAIDILNDYLQFGLYTNSNPEIRKQNTGNVIWNRVFKNSSPLPDKKGAPFYQDLIVRKTNYFSTNEITAIHSAVVAQLDKIFGWYFSDTATIAPSLKKAKLPFSPAKAIFLLKRELGKLFSDREIRLVKNLISILQMDLDNHSENLSFTGIPNFEHVWERMCGEIYQNENDYFSEFIPIPAYLIGEDTVLARNNRQRMDIIVSKNNSIAVLDAKYYDFSKSKPSWHDLVKQFYYQKSLSAAFPAHGISNFFIAPKNSSNLVPHMATVVNKEMLRLDAEFPPISIIYHCVVDVMKNYTLNAASVDYRANIFPS